MTREEELEELKALFITNQLTNHGKNRLMLYIETLQKKLQSSEKFAENLQRELNQRDKVINEVADYIKSDLLLFDNDSIEYEIGIEILKILERTDK